MISMNLFSEELEIHIEKEGANSPTILFGNGLAHDVHAPQCAAQHCRVLWCGCGLRRILRTHGDRPVHGLVLLLKPSPNRERVIWAVLKPAGDNFYGLLLVTELSP